MTKAEIIWCLKVVASHYSYRSCTDLSSVLHAMFPDSLIAQQFSMSYDKVAYFINFGIYPVVHDVLVANIRSASFFSVSFDESLNDVI